MSGRDMSRSGGEEGLIPNTHLYSFRLSIGRWCCTIVQGMAAHLMLYFVFWLFDIVMLGRLMPD